MRINVSETVMVIESNIKIQSESWTSEYVLGKQINTRDGNYKII